MSASASTSAFAAYLEEMDEADAQDEGVPELTPEQVEAALEKLKPA